MRPRSRPPTHTRPRRPAPRRSGRSQHGPCLVRMIVGTGLLLLLLSAGWWLWPQVATLGQRSGDSATVLGTTATATSVVVAPGIVVTATGVPATATATGVPATATSTVATVAPNARPTLPAISSIPLAMDDPALAQLMLDLINQDRQAHGLQPVDWDDRAAYAGALHAADMAAHSYFSHWSRSGHGPEYRYNQVGGMDSVMENIFTQWYRFDDGRPAPIDDFGAVVRRAQTGLMNSPGHRANILTPEHTHVGVGFAYNPETGSFYLAQEFINRYVVLQPLPAQAALGTTLQVVGELLPGASQPNINLTYQPFPQPMTLDELNATSSYSRDADIYQALNPHTTADGHFTAAVVLDHAGRAGLYSIRVWVNVQGQSVLASEWLIEVR